MNARELQRGLHFAQRTVGDYSAAKRGQLGQPLLRRIAVRNVFRLFR